MEKLDQVCPFCDISSPEMAGRIAYYGANILTIVSKPWFRDNHLLVIPRRHVTLPESLTSQESAAMEEEIKFLLAIIRNKFGGSMRFQKTDLRNKAGSPAVSHIHNHVYPLYESDTNLVPVPTYDDYENNKNHPTPLEIDTVLRHVEIERGRSMNP